MQCVQATPGGRDVYLKKLRVLYRERMADEARRHRARQAEDEWNAETVERKARKKKATPQDPPYEGEIV
jgi:hypothetical protein